MWTAAQGEARRPRRGTVFIRGWACAQRGAAGRWPGSRVPGPTAGSSGWCSVGAAALTGRARSRTPCPVAPPRTGACRPLWGRTGVSSWPQLPGPGSVTPSARDPGLTIFLAPDGSVRPQHGPPPRAGGPVLGGHDGVVPGGLPEVLGVGCGESGREVVSGPCCPWGWPGSGRAGPALTRGHAALPVAVASLPVGVSLTVGAVQGPGERVPGFAGVRVG